MPLAESTVREQINQIHRVRAHLVHKIADSGSGQWNVMVFALFGHPRAKFCYAWESEGRVHTELGDGLRGKSSSVSVKRRARELAESTHAG